MKAQTTLGIERALIAYARKFPLQKGKLRLIDHLWRVAAGNRGSRRVADLKYGGLKMPCDLAETLQRQFYFFGTYVLEEKILDQWMKAAKGARVIFDVGANVGIYSLAALAAEPNAIVHAFEPTPELAEKLRETARLNRLDDRLIVQETAVFSGSGEAILRRYRGGNGENEGMNYVCTDTGEAGAERVSAVCLDDYCDKHDIAQIDLLKLDVQGQEHAVLRGAEGLVKSGRLDTVFMELNWATKADCPATESVRLLAQAGYYFASPFGLENWQEAGPWLKSLSEVVARRFEK